MFDIRRTYQINVDLLSQQSPNAGPEHLGDSCFARTAHAASRRSFSFSPRSPPPSRSRRRPPAGTTIAARRSSIRRRSCRRRSRSASAATRTRTGTSSSRRRPTSPQTAQRARRSRRPGPRRLVPLAAAGVRPPTSASSVTAASRCSRGGREQPDRRRPRGGRRLHLRPALPRHRDGQRGQRARRRPARVPPDRRGTALITIYQRCRTTSRRSAARRRRSATASCRRSTSRTGKVLSSGTASTTSPLDREPPAGADVGRDALRLLPHQRRHARHRRQPPDRRAATPGRCTRSTATAARSSGASAARRATSRSAPACSSPGSTTRCRRATTDPHLRQRVERRPVRPARASSASTSTSAAHRDAGPLDRPSGRAFGGVAGQFAGARQRRYVRRLGRDRPHLRVRPGRQAALRRQRAAAATTPTAPTASAGRATPHGSGRDGAHGGGADARSTRSGTARPTSPPGTSSAGTTHVARPGAAWVERARHADRAHRHAGRRPGHGARRPRPHARELHAGRGRLTHARAGCRCRGDGGARPPVGSDRRLRVVLDLAPDLSARSREWSLAIRWSAMSMPAETRRGDDSPSSTKRSSARTSIPRAERREQLE